MPPQSRINLADMKSQIEKKIGPERARRYFGCLNRLLEQKLSKAEFNKLCLSILGIEFVPLHNQLIHSIFRNACLAKTPPPALRLAPGPANDKFTLKQNGAAVRKPPLKGDVVNLSPAPPPPALSNGDILPPSPRKGRSSIRDRRIKDRPTPLGPSLRADTVSHQPAVAASGENVIKENGTLLLCDSKRPVQHHQDGPAEQPAKRQRTENLLDHDRVSSKSKGLVEVVAANERDELVRSNELIPLQAPLGIPFCHASVGGARRSSLSFGCSSSTGGFSSNYDSNELCHTEALRKRMEKIAETHGLGGVTTECANLLNNGLDAYLKRLIKSCTDLAGARSGSVPIKQPVCAQQSHGKPINGVRLGNITHAQSTDRPLEGTHKLKTNFPISLHDFKVAMELNPQQLGEDWPLLLEKISLRSFEEEGRSK